MQKNLESKPHRLGQFMGRTFKEILRRLSCKEEFLHDELERQAGNIPTGPAALKSKIVVGKLGWLLGWMLKGDQSQRLPLYAGMHIHSRLCICEIFSVAGSWEPCGWTVRLPVSMQEIAEQGERD